MPPMKTPKAPSFLSELANLAGNLKDLPYNELAAALADAGWITALAQTDVTPTPTGSILVTFDLLTGKAYDSLERLDSITVTMPPNPGPVSVAARISARDSVLFMLTGRLPPRPVEGAQVPPPAAGQMNGGDHDERQVDMGDTDRVLAGTDEDADEAAAVRVIERREPDGLPIFRDLYEIGPAEADSTGEIISSVLNEVTTFLETASLEQVDALAIKNPDLLTFVKDLGTPADSAELRGAVTARKAALAARPEPAPRRRVSALQKAN
jgi:hypothetical protein